MKISKQSENNLAAENLIVKEKLPFYLSRSNVQNTNVKKP